MSVQELLRSRPAWVAAVGIAAVVAIASAWVLTGDDAGDPSGLPAFYLEAAMEAEDSSMSIGTQPAGAPGGAATAVHREGRVRWLHLSRDEARVELETVAPADEAGTDVIVYDGKDQWYYRHETNTYSQSPIPPVPDGVTMRVRPWSFGALIGPWFGAATNIEEFMAELRGMSSSATEVRVAGSGTVLGRTIVIVEQSPISTSSSGDGETRQGVARYWLDEDRMVVLRQEVDDGASQRFTIEVTRLEWNPAGERITFTPPDGATARPELDLGGDAVTPTSR